MKKSQKIEEFLLNFSSYSTIKTYRCHLNHYFNVLNVDPDTYFDTNRNYEQDVKIFWQSIIHRPPLTRNGAISVINTFLSENNIKLPEGMIKKLKKRTKGNRALTLDKVPTDKELKEILQYGTLKDRALFLLLCSSGMRISEVLQLTPSDVDLDHDPAQISIRGETTKTGNSRITFMTVEAKETVVAWLKERDEYLRQAVMKSKNKDPRFAKNAEDPRIFPLCVANARFMWNRLIKKAGYDERDKTTKRRKMHIQCLRKYFRTNLPSKEVSVDVVDALMGHEGYLTEAYRRYTPEQLASMYKKGMHNLIVMETQSDLSGIHEEMNAVKKENIQMKQEVHTLRNQVGEFQKILDDPKLAKEFALKLLPILEELKENK